MGETRPGLKPMRKSVAGQQHHPHHHHKREVAQAQVHPVPGAEVLELQEYVVLGDGGDLEASAPLKLTARTREANPTARRRKPTEAGERDEHEPECQAGRAAARGPAAGDDGGIVRDPLAAAGADQVGGIVPERGERGEARHGGHQTRVGHCAAGEGGNRRAARVCGSPGRAEPPPQAAPPRAGVNNGNI
ncbi:hypothetical protein C0J52_27748 [Blattella germanica]|nr:hypothetical protein C0J52_27748 [Blattella germanica]